MMRYALLFLSLLTSFSLWAQGNSSSEISPESSADANLFNTAKAPIASASSAESNTSSAAKQCPEEDPFNQLLPPHMLMYLSSTFSGLLKKSDTEKKDYFFGVLLKNGYETPVPELFDSIITLNDKADERKHELTARINLHKFCEKVEENNSKHGEQMNCKVPLVRRYYNAAGIPMDTEKTSVNITAKSSHDFLMQYLKEAGILLLNNNGQYYVDPRTYNLSTSQVLSPLNDDYNPEHDLVISSSLAFGKKSASGDWIHHLASSQPEVVNCKIDSVFNEGIEFDEKYLSCDTKEQILALEALGYAASKVKKAVDEFDYIQAKNDFKKFMLALKDGDSTAIENTKELGLKAYVYFKEKVDPLLDKLAGLMRTGANFDTISPIQDEIAELYEDFFEESGVDSEVLVSLFDEGLYRTGKDLNMILSKSLAALKITEDDGVVRPGPKEFFASINKSYDFDFEIEGSGNKTTYKIIGAEEFLNLAKTTKRKNDIKAGSITVFQRDLRDLNKKEALLIEQGLVYNTCKADPNCSEERAQEMRTRYAELAEEIQEAKTRAVESKSGLLAAGVSSKVIAEQEKKARESLDKKTKKLAEKEARNLQNLASRASSQLFDNYYRNSANNSSYQQQNPFAGALDRYFGGPGQSFYQPNNYGLPSFNNINQWGGQQYQYQLPMPTQPSQFNYNNLFYSSPGLINQGGYSPYQFQNPNPTNSWNAFSLVPNV